MEFLSSMDAVGILQLPEPGCRLEVQKLELEPRFGVFGFAALLDPVCVPKKRTEKTTRSHEVSPKVLGGHVFEVPEKLPNVLVNLAVRKLDQD
jgi:hypothetical protein